MTYVPSSMIARTPSTTRLASLLSLSSRTEAHASLDDLFGGLDPAERLGASVVDAELAVDRAFERLDEHHAGTASAR